MARTRHGVASSLAGRHARPTSVRRGGLRSVVLFLPAAWPPRAAAAREGTSAARRAPPRRPSLRPFRPPRPAPSCVDASPQPRPRRTLACCRGVRRAGELRSARCARLAFASRHQLAGSLHHTGGRPTGRCCSPPGALPARYEDAGRAAASCSRPRRGDAAARARPLAIAAGVAARPASPAARLSPRRRRENVERLSSPSSGAR